MHILLKSLLLELNKNINEPIKHKDIVSMKIQEQGVAEGTHDNTAISLSKLGKFHTGTDPLAEFVPERATAQYALHPDKWESTFYSLTNKDSHKLKYYGPKQISIRPGTLVGDMSIANKFYRAKTSEEKQQYADEYKASLQPYPVDVSQYRMPELLMPRDGGVAENITPHTIHKLADSKGIKWDNEPSFLKLTKKLTGKEHLDDLDEDDLQKVKNYLENTYTSGDPIGVSEAKKRKKRRQKYRQALSGYYGGLAWGGWSANSGVGDVGDVGDVGGVGGVGGGDGGGGGGDGGGGDGGGDGGGGGD